MQGLGSYMPISIHALREESDQARRNVTVYQQISIHALREESDSVTSRRRVTSPRFQSTLSVRRATVPPSSLDSW